MKIRINYDDQNLFCVYCKEYIEIGEKYVELMEDDVLKTYKLQYAPTNDEDDLYIA